VFSATIDGTALWWYNHVQDGTYYSDPFLVFKEGRDDPVTTVIDAQPYLSEVATRALIFIEADNPYIGLVCFMGIGMVEVSTCDIKDRQWKKGLDIGIFHYTLPHISTCMVWNLILTFMFTHQVLLQQIYQSMQRLLLYQSSA